MENQNVLNNTSPRQQEFSQRLMNLAIGRVYKNLHKKLGLEEKAKAEQIFELGSEEEKQKFMKKYLPNFENVYKIELAKLAEELKNEVTEID